MKRITAWLEAAEAWLDRQGPAAWIVAMVLGFVLLWPVGLALLGYMIWSGRMGCKRRWKHRRDRFAPSGNSAFDDYREATLKRLEDEQGAFAAFMEKLRQARDKAEFDRFMDDRDRPEASPA